MNNANENTRYFAKIDDVHRIADKSLKSKWLKSKWKQFRKQDNP